MAERVNVPLIGIRNHLSYLDRRGQIHEAELEDEDNEEEAKRLKHEADSEHNLEAKCTKYLQVITINLWIIGRSIAKVQFRYILHKLFNRFISAINL